jgi:dihydrofolate reductase
MRKIVVLSFVSLDGIMQAPGGPEEDSTGDFKFGGWTAPYFDEFAGKIMGRQMSVPADLLLGRKTFEIFASYWPQHETEWPTINKMTKYVVSNTLNSHSWQNTVFLKNVDEIKRLKQQEGPDLQVHGSANLIQTLMTNDLVDEFWLKIFPVTLGKGKLLFDAGTIPQAYTLLETKISPTGVIFANYKKAGEIKTGTVG